MADGPILVLQVSEMEMDILLRLLCCAAEWPLCLGHLLLCYIRPSKRKKRPCNPDSIRTGQQWHLLSPHYVHRFFDVSDVLPTFLVSKALTAPPLSF